MQFFQRGIYSSSLGKLSGGAQLTSLWDTLHLRLSVSNVATFCHNISGYFSPHDQIQIWQLEHDYASNECVGLDVDSFIFTNEPLSMCHDTMTVASDANYINSTDPLYIELADLQFYNFATVLCIERLDAQAFKNLSLSKDVYLASAYQ